MIIFEFAVNNAFKILSSTVLTILIISLSIFSLKHFSNVWTFTAFSLVVETPYLLLTVKSGSTEPLSVITFCCSQLTAIPMITSWSKPLAQKPSVLLLFLSNWNHFCYNKWITLETIRNKSSDKVRNEHYSSNSTIEVKVCSLISNFEWAFRGDVPENLSWTPGLPSGNNPCF